VGPTDGKLKVSIRHRDYPSLAAEIVSLIQATWRFRALTDFRWIGLGPSSRTLVTATVLGLEDLVRWIRSAPGESQYATTAFAQYDCQVRRCVSVCCLGSVLSVMLEDYRIPVVLGLVDREIDDELTWISGIAPAGWQTIVMCMGFEGKLRHACVSAAMVGAGYTQEGLRYVRQHPWTLCMDDHDAILIDVESKDCPTEEAARTYGCFRR
jgi:hypothetical protein